MNYFQLRDLNSDIHDYFMSNWWDDKHMWAHHLWRHLRTLSNNTNNRIESENAKLKAVMNSNTSLAQCIRSLFCHDTLNSERAYKAFLQNST